jgi:3-phenylpropionate/cinnamic acid dioxygenase small subunit
MLAGDRNMSDREQIHDLYVRYAFAIDARRYDEWIDYFTKDGVFDSSRLGRFEGHEQLRRFTEIYERAREGGQIRHVISNLEVEVTDDHARGACYLCLYRTKDGKTEMIGVGAYEDRLRKVGGKWLFESRKVVTDR